MLTFLRKIRKSLIESGSARKYLIYALGEIALVVIGILIALQINNRNENLKTKDFEIKMLNEVRNQLILDTSYFNMLLSRCTRVDTSANLIIEFLGNESDDREYFEHHARNLSWSYFFEYHVGAYDALKASGVEKISNDYMRSALIELYDFWLPRTKKMLGEFRSPEFRTLRNQWRRDIFDLEISVDDDGSPELRYDKYKFKEFDNPIFLDYLQMQHNMADNGISRIGAALERVTEVLELLSQELGYSN